LVLASAEIAFKSKISNLGFPKLSAKKTRVFAWVALPKFSGFEGSTNVVVIPSLGKVTLNKLYVPPYKLLDATIWSPAFSKTNNAVAIAAVPEAVTTAPMPPSSAASRCSKISLVGLFKRV